jgi:4-amino-4-deoxychorismate lyase
MKIGINGQMVDEQEAVISIFDHGFLYGIGLFETMRTYQKQCFLFDWHMERLCEGCDQIGIEWKMSAAEVKEQIHDLLEVNHLTDAYIRISVSAGPEGVGLISDRYRNPQTIIYSKPLPSFSAELYTMGKPLQILDIVRNVPETKVRLKSFQFMNNWLGRKEIGSHHREGLFMTKEGFLAEGITSNLFFIKNGILHTPSIETGILPGITRRFVLQLADNLELEAEEGLYPFSSLLEADEVFLTNSIQEIVPVANIISEGIDIPIGKGQIGTITRRLLDNYRQAVLKVM